MSRYFPTAADFEDAYLSAAERAMAKVVYRLLVEAQRYKTYSFFMGTADLQATAKEIAYDFKTTLKEELRHADHSLRPVDRGAHE